MFLFASRTGPFLPLHSLRTLRIIAALLSLRGRVQVYVLDTSFTTTYLQLTKVYKLPILFPRNSKLGFSLRDPVLLPIFPSSILFFLYFLFFKHRSRYTWNGIVSILHPIVPKCSSFPSFEATNQHLSHSVSRHLSDPKVELIGVVGLVSRELG